MDTPKNTDQADELLRVDPPPTCSPSLTPRTDALLVPKLETRVDAIMAFQIVTEHARTLERELAAARKPVKSLTPQTDNNSYHPAHGGAKVCAPEFARKLERERDKAIDVLMSIEERYIDGCDTYEDWKFMGDTARAFLKENTNVDAPAHD